MSSTQRLFEYCYLEEEGVFKAEKSFKINKGEIEFKNVCMRYRAELNLSLDNLSLKIPAGTKLGIMGRTGSGKSSLFTTLLRLVKPDSGNIYIDGKDYMKLGLYDLRLQISVIPQTPIIFSASIKHNIDPFNNYTDDYLKEILKSINLDHILNSTNEGLEAKYGDNLFLSTGEKQLLCLARAMAKNSKILLIDEATPNVDKETEEVIQKSIYEKISRKNYPDYCTQT